VTIEQLGAILAPFVAVLGASAWLHSSLSSLRETMAGLIVRLNSLEKELDRLRAIEMEEARCRASQVSSSRQ
jgi:hypothetical protein